MADITLEGVAHRYGDDAGWALADLDLTWTDGGAYALLGPSGCGKTTMLNIISGLLAPTTGRVLFDGRDVTALPGEQRNIAHVFQFPVVYESMTVEENLRFPLRNQGASRAEARVRAGEIAELLGIEHLLGSRSRQLTADAKQLVSLGRALVRREVAAILFDEPLTVVDPQRKWEVRQALKRVHAELEHTLVYVTHDQTEALTFADEVVVVNEGRVLQRGAPETLFAQPAHVFVGNFIGSPGMNFFPAAVVDGVAEVGGVPLLRLPATAPDGDTWVGDDGDVIGFRPELTRIHPDGGPITAGVPVEVEAVHDIGRATMVAFSLDGRTGSARLPAGTRLATGAARLTPVRAQFFRHGHAVDGCSLMAEPALADATGAPEAVATVDEPSCDRDHDPDHEEVDR